MKIKAGEVEETVKNIMNRYLTGGEIEPNEFEYIKKYSRYLRNYKFIKRQGGKNKMITLGLAILDRNNKNKDIYFYGLTIAADCYIIEKIISIFK